MSDQMKLDLKAIRNSAGPYAAEAIQFVRDGLAHTARKIHGENPGPGQDRHVNGPQLCLGLRDYAVGRYGLLARTVLHRWGITRTEDFGRIVFALIEAGILRRSDDDSAEDFRSVFEFDEAFANPLAV